MVLGRVAFVACWVAGPALVAAQVPPTPEPAPAAVCAGAAATALYRFEGVTAERDGVLFIGPRTQVHVDGIGVPASWWLDGKPLLALPAKSIEGPWMAGPHELVALAPDGCGGEERFATRFTVDDKAPSLGWRVARVEDLKGQTPDRGREKRYLWWWLQPERRRLVWTDGAANWAVVRRFPGTVVEAASGRPTIYVWAPEGNPFDKPEGEHALEADRILVLEGADETSGILGMRLSVVEDRTSPESGRRSRNVRPIRLVASAVDRAGNSVSVDLPYRR